MDALRGRDASSAKKRAKRPRTDSSRAAAPLQTSSTESPAKHAKATDAPQPQAQPPRQQASIDELFSTAILQKKQAKMERIEEQAKASQQQTRKEKGKDKDKEKHKQKQKQTVSSANRSAPSYYSDSARPVRRDNQLKMNIYKEDALGLNIPNAGYTKDCPFDCNCCF